MSHWVGARDASGSRMDFNKEAYDQLGDHLRNDQKQSRYVMIGLIFGALASILFLLWMIYWQPVTWTNLQAQSTG
jgi:hypothetical protein